jgi:hypothetical protein
MEISIAKYKKQEYPNEWFLTDFTMKQIELRIKNLELEISKLNNLKTGEVNEGNTH